MIPYLILGLWMLSAAALAAFATWFVCVKLVPPRPRRWVKWVYPLLVAAPVAYATVSYAAPRIGDHIQEGDFVCASCGRIERHVLCNEKLVETRAPLSTRRHDPSSDLYERAFHAQHPDHLHEWLEIGCQEFHLRGGVIDQGCTACTMLYHCQWFEDLPQLPDRALTEACVERFDRTPAQDRYSILRSYDLTAEDEPDVPARFAKWHEGWRRDHPDWP